MNYFPPINRWLVPSMLLAQSIEEMAIDGRDGNEGTCFWLGQRANSEATVSHLVILRGNGILKSPFNLIVSAELMREVHDEAMSRGLILIAQIHSHSTECGVDMSETDHDYGISVPFFLSVICPHYAQNPQTTFADCGIHICLPKVGYVRSSEEKAKKQIVQLTGESAALLIVGEKT